MFLRRQFGFSLAFLLCVVVRRRMLCFSSSSPSVVVSRGSSLDSLIWSLKERPPPSFLRKIPSVEHFKTFSCSERANQLYPDLSSGCRNYFRCLGGVTYSYSCKEGESFQMSSQECQSDDDVDCPSTPPSTQKCWQQPDGFYPDYDKGCAFYYSCHNGSLDEVSKCEGSSIWDSATGSCGFGQNVVCSPPSCLGLRDGFYPLQGSACTAYYSCSQGFRTDMLCPFGSIFDYMTKQCVSGEDAVCYERACEGRINGYYAAPRAKCNTFYKCFNGAMVQLDECGRGQVFDGRSCAARTNFSCWREGEGSCGNQPDGYYASKDGNCRGFFYCNNKKMIRSFRCDRGLFFNGKKCVDSRNFICNPRPLVPDCTNRFDGYYTVEKTNCKTFFRCKNGKKLSEHNCPGNHVFNGNHCVSPLFYSCTNKAPGIQRSLPDNGVYRKYDY